MLFRSNPSHPGLDTITGTAVGDLLTFTTALSGDVAAGATITVINSAVGSFTIADTLPSPVDIFAKIELSYDNFLTRSPAWSIASILRGPGQPVPVEDDFLDGDSLADWDTFCGDPAGDGTQPAMKFDVVVDTRQTVYELISAVASSAQIGRAHV